MHCAYIRGGQTAYLVLSYPQTGAIYGRSEPIRLQVDLEQASCHLLLKDPKQQWIHLVRKLQRQNSWPECIGLTSADLELCNRT